MRLRQLPLVTHEEQLKKVGSACEHGFMFRDGLLCCTHSGNKVSLVIPEDTGLRTDLLW